MQDHVCLVFDVPFADLALLKLHGLGPGGGEIDKILIGSVFAADHLKFGWVSHEDASFLSSHTTRQIPEGKQGKNARRSKKHRRKLEKGQTPDAPRAGGDLSPVE
jgi:hypothetical protein